MTCPDVRPIDRLAEMQLQPPKGSFERSWGSEQRAIMMPCPALRLNECRWDVLSHGAKPLLAACAHMQRLTETSVYLWIGKLCHDSKPAKLHASHLLDSCHGAELVTFTRSATGYCG